MPGKLELESLRRGGKAALARAISRLENRGARLQEADFLDQVASHPKGRLLGLTGPPGVGKSTLITQLVSHWRQEGLSVAVLAVDPSSQRTGGALLGDRTRFTLDPEDKGVFVRSVAARDRLGGLSDDALVIALLLRAVFDRVIIETVGIGQSEADIEFIADTKLLCVQPASGDSLQFMKAGIMETPDIVVVTKSDMGEAARRARADIEAALGLFGDTQKAKWEIPVMSVSATQKEGLEPLFKAIDDHGTFLEAENRLMKQRRLQAHDWVLDGIRGEFGRSGLRAFKHTLKSKNETGRRFVAGDAPFQTLAAVFQNMNEKLRPPDKS